MKKAIISPLCSAFVIPGLGQVLNQHLKKGAFILVAVFIIFITGAIKLFRMLSTALAGIDIRSPDTSVIMDRLKAEDPFFLWCLVIALGILWIYSVLDAFLCGREIDEKEKGSST
ncbi:MAG: hypothetical protein V1689_01435 [Pseudomonadota bacterium]